LFAQCCDDSDRDSVNGVIQVLVNKVSQILFEEWCIDVETPVGNRGRSWSECFWGWGLLFFAGGLCGYGEF
jgi:hypothetical protein